MVLAEVCGTTFHVDDKLAKRWDKIKDGQLKKLDEDRVYVVDGRERCGKSLFTIQQSAYIDPSIITDAVYNNDMTRITFSAQETLSAIQNTNSTSKETKVIIFDEAFRGLSNRAALSKTNKMIIQALMEMGQKNLVLFIVLPSFYMLDMYPAVLRSNALFHIKKEKNSRRRTFLTFPYNKKSKLHQIGMKKGWGYPINTSEVGRFFNKYPGGKVFEEKYREKKLKSLNMMEFNPVKIRNEEKLQTEKMKALYTLYFVLRFVGGWNKEQLNTLLRTIGIGNGYQTIKEHSEKLPDIAGKSFRTHLEDSLFNNYDYNRQISAINKQLVTFFSKRPDLRPTNLPKLGTKIPKE